YNAQPSGGSGAYNIPDQGPMGSGMYNVPNAGPAGSGMYPAPGPGEYGSPNNSGFYGSPRQTGAYGALGQLPPQPGAQHYETFSGQGGQHQQPDKQSQKKAWLLPAIGIGVLMLGIVAMLGYKLLSGGEEPPPEQPVPEQVEGAVAPVPDEPAAATNA